jgi:hypothetical protein
VERIDVGGWSGKKKKMIRQEGRRGEEKREQRSMVELRCVAMRNEIGTICPRWSVRRYVYHRDAPSAIVVDGGWFGMG